MKTILDYCLHNFDTLLQYRQPSFKWKQNYDLSKLCKIPNFEKLINNLPDEISREHIIESVSKHEFYQSFLLIMLWGQLGVRPSTNKSKKTEIAFRVFELDPKRINEIFQIIIEGKEEKIKELYLSLERGGSRKIPEVDVSYFTKIISFASAISTESSKQYLIYDKWTKLIHIHLMFDRNENPEIFYSKQNIQKLSTEGSKKRYSTKLIYPLAGEGWGAYKDYCDKMYKIALQISNDRGHIISPLQLEGFLFGSPLKASEKRDESNPRYWIQRNINLNYF